MMNHLLHLDPGSLPSPMDFRLMIVNQPKSARHAG